MASANPIPFLLAAVVIAWIAHWLTAWYYKDLYRERSETHKERIDNHANHIAIKDSEIDLMEKKIEGLKEEADNYKSELAKLKQGYSKGAIAIQFGNDNLKEAFRNIEGPVVTTVEVDIIGKNADKYAAYARLKDLGLVTMHREFPGTLKVTSTSAAVSVSNEIKNKKPSP